MTLHREHDLEKYRQACERWAMAVLGSGHATCIGLAEMVFTVAGVGGDLSQEKVTALRAWLFDHPTLVTLDSDGRWYAYCPAVRPKAPAHMVDLPLPVVCLRRVEAHSPEEADQVARLRIAVANPVCRTLQDVVRVSALSRFRCQRLARNFDIPLPGEQRRRALRTWAAAAKSRA